MKDYVQGGTLTEVTDLILLSLYEPRHGYAIIQFVEEVTNGRVLLGAGTLYGALSSLEQKDGLNYKALKVQAEKSIFNNTFWKGGCPNRNRSTSSINRLSGKDFKGDLICATKRYVFLVVYYPYKRNGLIECPNKGIT